MGRERIGPALIAWYEASTSERRQGLVTQAQAAQLLNISRPAVTRLVNRGHLRAVYFPKAPEIPGLALSNDDPMWVKIYAWVSGGIQDPSVSFPKAVFVSFEDVKRLWETGTVKEKSAFHWRELADELQKDERPAA